MSNPINYIIMKGNKPLAFYYNKYGGDTQAALEYTKDLILKYKKLKNKNFSDIILAIELLKTIGANIVIYERMIKDDNKLCSFLIKKYKLKLYKHYSNEYEYYSTQEKYFFDAICFTNCDFLSLKEVLDGNYSSFNSNFEKNVIFNLLDESLMLDIFDGYCEYDEEDEQEFLDLYSFKDEIKLKNNLKDSLIFIKKLLKIINDDYDVITDEKNKFYFSDYA